MKVTATGVARTGYQHRSASPAGGAEAALRRFERHIAAHMDALERIHQVLPAVADAAEIMTGSLATGGKLLACGNGGSAAEAEHFVTELVGRFRYDRPALAACALSSDGAALTAIANDYGYAQVFARQVEALARPGDVLLAISTSGESESVTRAAQAATRLGVQTVAMTGAAYSLLARLADVALRAPSDDTPTVQETHMLFTHLLCDAVEWRLCPDGEAS